MTSLIKYEASDLIAEVRSLMHQDKGDRVIAGALKITRHEARSLMREVELADAKRTMPYPETMPAVLSHDVDAWALLINGAFRRSYDSTIEAGRLLIAAKEKLAPHGTWLPMLETKLDFSPDTAQRLMAIARDERLTNTEHVRFLPRSSSTLYALTRLSDEQFAHGIELKIISPDMERRDVDRLRPRPEGHMRDAYTPESSDGRGSQTGDDFDPAALGLQQGLDTSSIPGTAAGLTGPQGEGTGAASVANPERQPDVPDGSPVSPSPSETPSMPGGGLAIAHNRIEPSDSLDYFPTPPWATRALFEHAFVDLPNPADNCWNVWEPACGEGHMAEVLREYCSDVEATDIFDYRYGDRVLDFLSEEASNACPDWIITNPPFGDNSAAFVERALDIAQAGVAMFVRLQWLEGVGRYERIFKDQPPTRIAFFAERVPLHKGRWEPDGDTMTAYIWLVWIKGEEPRAPFWIPPGCREALTRPDDAVRFTQHPVAKAGAAPPAAEAAE